MRVGYSAAPRRASAFMRCARFRKLDLRGLEAVDDLGGARLQERVDQQERNRDHQREGGVVHRDRDRGGQQFRLLGRVDVGHRRERLDQADDGAEQADQRDHVGEGRDVVRALLEPRHDLHHALLHRGVDVLAASGRLQALDAVADDLADRDVGVAGRGLRLVEASALQQRQHLVPQLAVVGPRAVEEDEAFDRHRQAERHDGNAGVDEQPAVLEELDDGVERIHERFSESRLMRIELTCGLPRAACRPCRRPPRARDWIRPS